MTDAAPDNEKRSHGALWYFAYGLTAYFLSFLPVVILANWLHDRDLISERATRVATLIYVPIYFLIVAVGLEPAADELLRWISLRLP